MGLFLIACNQEDELPIPDGLENGPLSPNNNIVGSSREVGDPTFQLHRVNLQIDLSNHFDSEDDYIFRPAAGGGSVPEARWNDLIYNVGIEDPLNVIEDHISAAFDFRDLKRTHFLEMGAGQGYDIHLVGMLPVHDAQGPFNTESFFVKNTFLDLMLAGENVTLSAEKETSVSLHLEELLNLFFTVDVTSDIEMEDQNVEVIFPEFINTVGGLDVDVQGDNSLKEALKDYYLLVEAGGDGEGSEQPIRIGDLYDASFLYFVHHIRVLNILDPEETSVGFDFELAGTPVRINLPRESLPASFEIHPFTINIES